MDRVHTLQDGFQPGADVASIAATAGGVASMPSAPPTPRVAGTPSASKPVVTVASSNLRPPARHPSLRRTKNSTDKLRTRRGGGPLALDSVSGGRAGRNFTVGNIGNNGRIYLRPVTRPGGQTARSATRPFVFPPAKLPVTVAKPARDLRPGRPSSDAGIESVYTGYATPLPGHSARAKAHAENPHSAPQSPRRPGTSHNRAHSFSTVDEHAQTQTQVQEPGQSIRVVIHRPSVTRPKTTENGPLPVLEVPIPHYRLGTPQFSPADGAYMRSSGYTGASGTDDPRSSVFSRNGHERLFPSPPVMTHSSYHSGREWESAWPSRQPSTSGRVSLRPSPLPPASERASKIVIVPELYDAFTFNPDDPTSIRFSPTTGDIVAATPSRLIAHITSPSFLDYELLSDFFLTFRAFMASQDLIAHLIARMRWAVDRADDFGRIVRVRTFVALRHWILNYFVDDFLPDYRLRVQFCMLTNGLYDYLRNRMGGGGGDRKIIGELKKCWRRTCSQYWDDSSIIGFDQPDQDIVPGPKDGAKGFTVRAEGGQFAKQQNGNRAQVASIFVSRLTGQGDAAAVPSFKSIHHTPQQSLASATPWSAQTVDGAPISPRSERSVQVLSCSIPMRPVYRVDPSGDIPLNPHPVHIPPGSVAGGQTVARISRPARTHKRSGSFSDALRDNRAPLATPKQPTDEAQAVAQTLPGSLIRGAIFQPDSPYIEVRLGSSIKSMHSHTDIDGVDGLNAKHLPYSQGPGVKKLLGTVRRALSSKHSVTSAGVRSAAHTHVDPSAPSTAKISRTATVASGVSTAAPTPRRKRLVRGRPQIRIDILSSQAGESFRKAIEAQKLLENHGEPQTTVKPPPEPRDSFQLQEEPPMMQRADEGHRKTFDLITPASRSIVIMDDTRNNDAPWMSGALPPSTLATESLVGSGRPSMPKRSVSLSRHATSGSRAMSIDQVISGSGPDASASPSVAPLRTKGVASRPIEYRRPTGYHSNRMRAHHRSASSSQLRYDSYQSSESGVPRRASFASVVSELSSANDAFFLEKVPLRQLRRRPGGDLRAVDTVHDLEPVLRRPRSTGSLSNVTHSVTNSVAISPLEPGMFSLELELARQRIKEESSVGSTGLPSLPALRKSISLVDTHSSQQNLRPSFEAEVAKLAALPDDASDDGGIEAALLKLEGRYEKRASEQSRSEQSLTPVDAPEGWDGRSPLALDAPEDDDKRKHRNELALEADYQSALSNAVHEAGRPTVSVAARSEDSYSSVPLLERGLSGVVARAPKMAAQVDPRATTAKRRESPETVDSLDPTPRNGSITSSMERIEETDSMRRIPKGSTIPTAAHVRESFLLEDDGALTDDSPSTLDNSETISQGVRSFFDDEPADGEDDHGDDNPMFTHPLRFPPTPPVSADDVAKRIGAASKNDPRRTVPVEAPISPPAEVPPTTPSPRHHTGQATLRVPSVPSSGVPSNPPHLPFILAYDAEHLTQQFTIIEKDALDEIDWKELIELRWKQTSPAIRDWVEYLRTQIPRGVDVVIARFNLMVKWAVSELILTEALDERVSCIVQYIRIAAHARRIRNYATMYQLTIALLSSDVSRMKRTWEAVPAAELATFAELERLVQPVRNFHHLRLEMETAAVEHGCIPFIGIYTRDLVYNAQKPAVLGTPPRDPRGEPLVNFERHHTAAAIVKSLLRLLEASSKYRFQPDPAVIGKCLWVTALGDEEIAAMSRLRE